MTDLNILLSCFREKMSGRKSKIDGAHDGKRKKNSVKTNAAQWDILVWVVRLAGDFLLVLTELWLLCK